MIFVLLKSIDLYGKCYGRKDEVLLLSASIEIERTIEEISKQVNIL